MITNLARGVCYNLVPLDAMFRGGERSIDYWKKCLVTLSFSLLEWFEGQTKFMFKNNCIQTDNLKYS